MRIAILIMSTEMQPSLRNVEALKNTIIKQTNEQQFQNEYDFFIYSYVNGEDTDTVKNCTQDSVYKNCYNIHINGIESVYHTYEKTYVTYKYLLDNESIYGKYDKFIRINISCYLNMRLLDSVIADMKEDIIYTNAINSYINMESVCPNKLYPRGDFYIVSHSELKGIIKAGKSLMYCDQSLKERNGITHVDDTLFGYAFILYRGATEYHKHLQMIKYNFLPFTIDQKEAIDANLNTLSISSRVKTTPPGVVSGYSWDDNEWRMHDMKKIEYIHKMLKDKKYENISLESILISPLQERVTVFVNAVNMTPSQIIALTQ